MHDMEKQECITFIKPPHDAVKSTFQTPFGQLDIRGPVTPDILKSYRLAEDLKCFRSSCRQHEALIDLAGHPDGIFFTASLANTVISYVSFQRPDYPWWQNCCMPEIIELGGLETDLRWRKMGRLSLKYAEGLESIINRLGLPACVTIEGPLGGIQFVPEKPHTYRQANKSNKNMWSEYWYGMLCKGVIPMGSGWFEEYSISAAHTEEDIDETLNRTEDVLQTIKESM